MKMFFDKILKKEKRIKRRKFQYNYIKIFAFKDGYRNINNYNVLLRKKLSYERRK